MILACVCIVYVFIIFFNYENGQIGDVLGLLRGGEGGARMFESYPVVTGLDAMAFVGTISRKDLVRDSIAVQYL